MGLINHLDPLESGSWLLRLEEIRHKENMVRLYDTTHDLGCNSPVIKLN